MKMQKWANASCKSTLSLWVITMHNQKYSQPRFTCKQQWLHSIFIIRRWKFHKRTVNNCSQPINYILWWIYFLLKGCNVAYKSEIDLRSTRSRLNYLKLWLIFLDVNGLRCYILWNQGEKSTEKTSTADESWQDNNEYLTSHLHSVVEWKHLQTFETL